MLRKEKRAIFIQSIRAGYKDLQTKVWDNDFTPTAPDNPDPLDFLLDDDPNPLKSLIDDLFEEKVVTLEPEEVEKLLGPEDIEEIKNMYSDSRHKPDEDSSED